MPPQNGLPEIVGKIIIVVKEAGAIGLAIIIVCFYLGQQAGWISNVDRAEHQTLIEETKRQTFLLADNQRILKELVEQSRANQGAFLQVARGICISVTKSFDIERRCLGNGVESH